MVAIEAVAIREAASWRAVFRYPRLRADQLAIAIPSLVPVEVYRRTRKQWDAREPVSQNSYGFDGVDSAAAAKARIEKQFRECVEPWKPFDAAGNLIEGEVCA